MPELMRAVEGAGDAVPFTRVRVVLRNEDGSVAKDTMIDFPSTADSVALALQLQIPSSAPASGLPLSLTMAYVNADGDTVFRGGPSAIVARPVGSSGADAPVVVPIAYDGAGKDAASVTIAPKTGTGLIGTSLAFTATARDAQGAAIPNTPFVFFSLDTANAQINAATGVATWRALRGNARIVAALPNGLRADTATIGVILPASKMIVGTGAAQTGAVNAPLADSVVLRTLAADDVPVAGVIVSFAVASGGGSLSTITDTSDVNGNVSTKWTLGAALGAQGITATASGLTGSPLAISATGVAGPPTRLEITTQPATAIAGSALTPALVVQARDAFGNVASSFTGNVSVAVLGTQPPALTGTAAVAAVNGVATFSDLSIAVVGTYMLTVTSGTLTPDSSSNITINPATASQLALSAQPPDTAVAGTAFAVAVQARDAFSNLTPAYTDSASVTISTGPVGGVLSGVLKRAVTAGSAEFTGLTVNRAGSYQLSISAPSLTSASTVSFVAKAAAPASVVKISGDAQSAAVSTTLANPLVVEVRDASGNPVEGASVAWTVSSGTASVTVATVLSNASGVASTGVVLGSSAGVVGLRATVAALAPAEFTATAVAGPASGFTLISGADQVLPAGGSSDSVRVRLNDASGNPVAGATVTWNQTSDLTFSPASGVTDADGRVATIVTTGGTLGAKSFSASSSPATDVVVNLQVLAGPADSLSVVSGANQQGYATEVLPSPVVLRVLDAFNNVRIGDSVFVKVTSGGGLLGNSLVQDTLISDSQGAVSIPWTLGTFVGEQAIEVRTGALTPRSIAAQALQLQANAIWTGNSNSVVGEALNWRNGLVPSALDSVLIPAGRPNYPVLSGGATYAKLIVESGATFDISNYNLVVTGSIRAPLGSGIIATGSGTVLDQAGVGTLTGTFPSLDLQGNYLPSGVVDVVGSLTIGNSASLTVQAGDSLHVGGILATESGGRLVQSGNSGISVTGNLQLDGGESTFGAGGRLHLFGNLGTGSVGSPRAFLADSAHTLILRPNNTQSITFAYPDSTPGGACDASCLGILQSTKGSGQGGVTFNSTVMARGGLQLDVQGIVATGQYVISGAPATIRGGSGGAFFRRFGFTGSYDASGPIAADTLVALGSGVLPTNLTIPTIVSGNYQIVGPHLAALIVEGSLEAEGASASVSSTLRTRGSGHLLMNSATDSLVVFGELRFEGVASAGQLTAGVLDARSNVYAGTGASIFADSAHVLRLASATPTLSVADSANSRFGSLRIADNTSVSFSGVGAKFAGDVVLGPSGSLFIVSGNEWIEIGGRLVDPVGSRFLATTILKGTNAIETPEFGADRLILRGSSALNGNFAVIGGLWIESGGNFAPNEWTAVIEDSLITSGTGIITMNSPEDTITVLRAALFNGGASVLTAGRLRVQARFDVGSPQGFQGQPAHRTEFFGVNFQQVGFSYPGFGIMQSHFGRVELNKDVNTPASSTAVFVNGQIFTARSAQRWSGVGSITPLTVRGANVTDLWLTNQPLVIVDGADVTSLADLRFTGFEQGNVTQLSIQRSGGSVTVFSPAFDSMAVAPVKYLSVDDVADDANTLTVAVTDPQPTGHSGRISTDGVALISGWNQFAVFNWTGAAGNSWSNPANWQQGFPPGPNDSVLVSTASIIPVITSPVSIRSLTWLNNLPLQLYSFLYIRQSYSGGGANPGVSCATGSRIFLNPSDSAKVSGWVLCPVHVVSGVVRPAGTFRADSLLIEGTSEFHVRNELVDLSGTLRTSNNGSLRMQGSTNAGEVKVRQNAIFAGASTAGKLTTGTLTVHRGFTQLSNTSAESFAPSGSHRTVLGDSTEIILIDGPPPTYALSFANTASSWFNDLNVALGWYDITATARSRGGAQVSGRLQGKRFAADSGLRASSGQITLDHLSIAGVADIGFNFAVDTVEFRGPVGGGPEQHIPAFNGETSIPYQTVVVAGPNVVMSHIGASYRVDSLLHITSGSLLFGSGVDISATAGTLNVAGNAVLQWASSPPVAVRFDSVRVATSSLVAPTAGSFNFRSFSQVGMGNFRPTGSFTATQNGTGVIDFDDEAGGAYFHNLAFAPGSTSPATASLTSSVMVNGTLSRTSTLGTVNIQSNQLDLNSRVLTVNGGLGFPGGGEQLTRFRNVRLELTGNYSLATELQFNKVTFERMDPNPTPAFLRTQHTGAAAAIWQNITFDSPLQSGRFFQWDGTGIGSITFQNASPALDCLTGTCTPGALAPSGTGGVSLVWAGGVSSAWTNAANWLPAIVPNFTSNVTIPDAATTLYDPTVDATTTIGSLTVQTAGVLNIDLSDTLNLFGSLTVNGVVNAGDLFSAVRLRTTALQARNISAAGGIATRFIVDRGLGNDAGNAVMVGPVNLTATNFQSGLYLNAGILDVNGQTLSSLGGLRVTGSGILEMNQATDSVFVSWNVLFDGADSEGYLTDGTLVSAQCCFTQSNTTSNKSFVATGNHRVVFSGGENGSQVDLQTSSPTTSRFNHLRFAKTGGQWVYFYDDTVYTRTLDADRGNMTIDYGSLIVLETATFSDSIYVYMATNGILDIRGAALGACATGSVYAEGSLGNFRPTSCHTAPLTWTDYTAGAEGVNWRAIAAGSATRLVAVGAGGALAYSSFSSGWQQNVSSGTTNNLNAVAGLNENFWAVGDGGTIVSWPSGSPTTSTTTVGSENLNAVYVFAADSIYAAGNNGSILFYNGVTWTSQTSNTGEHLYDIEYTVKDGIVAVGANGAWVRSSGDGSWITVASGTSANLRAIVNVDGIHYFVGGDAGTVRERWGSSVYAFTPTPAPMTNSLFAGAEFNLKRFMVGANGQVLQQMGDSWTTIAGPAAATLRGTAFLNNNPSIHLIVVGDNGTIYRAIVGPSPVF